MAEIPFTFDEQEKIIQHIATWSDADLKFAVEHIRPVVREDLYLMILMQAIKRELVSQNG